MTGARRPATPPPPLAGCNANSRTFRQEPRGQLVCGHTDSYAYTLPGTFSLYSEVVGICFYWNQLGSAATADTPCLSRSAGFPARVCPQARDSAGGEV